MKTLTIFILLGTSWLLPSSLAYSQCFDFQTKVTQPLRLSSPRAPSTSKEKADIAESGKLESGVVWAGIKGEVERNIRDLLKLLFNHNATKSKRVSEVKVTHLKSPHYLDLHQVIFELHPFPFITVSWEEAWAYALDQGTPEDPKRVVISYQKIAGTDYIKHLCGNIVLTKLGPQSTEIYVYEEVKATQRTEQDTVKGVTGTLRTLREFQI